MSVPWRSAKPSLPFVRETPDSLVDCKFVRQNRPSGSRGGKISACSCSSLFRRRSCSCCTQFPPSVTSKGRISARERLANLRSVPYKLLPLKFTLGRWALRKSAKRRSRLVRSRPIICFSALSRTILSSLCKSASTSADGSPVTSVLPARLRLR